MKVLRNFERLSESRQEQLLDFLDDYEQDYPSIGSSKELAINTIDLLGADDFMKLLHEKGYLLQLNRDCPAEKFVAENFDSIISFADHIRENVTGEDSLNLFFTRNWETRHYLSPKLYQDVLDGKADKDTRKRFDYAVALTLVNHFMDCVTYSILKRYEF